MINGMNIDSNRAENWHSFEEAIQYTGKNSITGIGFVFTEADDLVGIDIDGCVENGTFNQVAEEILCQLKGKAYAEYSPSGRGIHLITKGAKTSTRSKNSEYGLEVYQNKRYFTVTGNMLDGYEKIDWAIDGINSICTTFLEKGDEDEQLVLLSERADVRDESIIDIIFRGKSGNRLRSLYDGDWKGYYQSQSEADIALCNALAFYTAKDASQMDVLFRKSGLYRSKWDRIHYTDGSTYGDVVIEKAIKDTGNVFDRKSQRDKAESKKPTIQKPELPHWYMK